MSAERRLDALEASLSPTQLVLLWRDEAHAFGDLESYVRSLLDVAHEEQPIDRLVRQVQKGARAAHRGRARDQVEATVRAALRETVFRYELVLRINATALEMLDRERLLTAALGGQLWLRASEDAKERRSGPSYLLTLASLRDLITGRVTEVRAAYEARVTVERRYLEGHPALFPDAVRSWAEQLSVTEQLADCAVRIAEIDGVPPAAEEDRGAVADRVSALVADLLEPAKATALEKLGEGERAMRIAISWLRPKLEQPVPRSRRQRRVTGPGTMVS